MKTAYIPKDPSIAEALKNLKNVEEIQIADEGERLYRFTGQSSTSSLVRFSELTEW